ncbi:putative reverse transcriptase domain-containing protein [Tanacetum coccineum]
MASTLNIPFLLKTCFKVLGDRHHSAWNCQPSLTEALAKFELKGQFIKELRDNTFSGSDNEDSSEHIENVLEIVDLLHIPNVTQDQYCPPARTAKKIEESNNFQQDPDDTLYQAWERFKELLLRCPQHYLTDMQEVISFYKGLDVPTRQILDSKGAIPSMKAVDAKKDIQDMVDHSKKWHNRTFTMCRSTETSDGLATIQAQLNNLGREIKNVNEKVCQGASIKALEIQIGQMSKISATVETGTTPIHRIGPNRYAISGPQNSKLFFVLSQATIPFPSHLYDDCYDEEDGSVMPFSTYTNLGLGKLAPTKLIVELADRTVKCPKGIVENVLVGIDKFVFPVDFIVLDMPEDIKTSLIIGRPFLSIAQAKINVFKRKITLRVGNDKVIFKSDKPTSNIIKRVYALRLRERMELDLELRRNRVDDLEPTIKEGEVVNEPMMDIVKTRCDNEIIDGLDEYPSYCDCDRKIHIDCACNLQFSCMIDFVVVENMDSYRDKGMGDVIVGRPFCREACLKARLFDGMITMFKGNDSVTYQMA